MAPFFRFEIVNIFFGWNFRFFTYFGKKVKLFLLTSENNKNHNIHIVIFLVSTFKEFRHLILYITVYTELL